MNKNMQSIWLRLGGFVSADEKTMAKILNGDKDALISAIRENGFEVEGDAYIPEDSNEINGEEVNFDFNWGVTLK